MFERDDGVKFVCWRTGLWIPGSHWRAPEDDRRGGTPEDDREGDVLNFSIELANGSHSSVGLRTTLYAPLLWWTFATHY